MDLVQKAYQAKNEAMVPGKGGIPTCFAPMPFEQLQPEVKEAYEAAYLAIMQDNLSCSAGTLGQVGYKAWAKRLGGSHRPYAELAVSLQNGWSAFARVISTALLETMEN